MHEDDLGAQFFISERHIGVNVKSFLHRRLDVPLTAHVQRAQAALPQIQKLNPRVSLHVDTDPILLKDPAYFAPFSLVIATDLPHSTVSTVNASCRLSNRPFYAAGTHGFYGFIFVDLITHDFVIEREKSNIPTVLKPETATRSIIASSTKKSDNGKLVEIVTKRETYSPIILANSSPVPASLLSSRRRRMQISPLLTCFKALWEFQSISNTLPSHSHADLELFTTLATEKHRELQLPPETLHSEFLRSFLQNLGSELVPVTAFLGGQLAQDVINVLGQREQPIQNLLLFDGEECKGPVYAMHPIFPPLEGEVV